MKRRISRALLGISRRSMKLARRIHPGIVEELKVSNEAIRVFKAIHERQEEHDRGDLPKSNKVDVTYVKRGQIAAIMAARQQERNRGQ